MKLSLVLSAAVLAMATALFQWSAPGHKPGKVVCRITLAQDAATVDHNDGYTPRSIYVPWRGLGVALRRDQYMASEPAGITRYDEAKE